MLLVWFPCALWHSLQHVVIQHAERAMAGAALLSSMRVPADCPRAQTAAFTFGVGELTADNRCRHTSDWLPERLESYSRLAKVAGC